MRMDDPRVCMDNSMILSGATLYFYKDKPLAIFHRMDEKSVPFTKFRHAK